MQAKTTALYTIVEAAERLRIHRSTIYGLMRRGQIEIVEIGGRTFVPEDEIDRLIEEGRTRRGGDAP